MLYTAVLVACMSLIPEPKDCRTHEFLVQGGPIPISAAIEAQNLAAQWLTEHPGLQQLRLTIEKGVSA